MRHRVRYLVALLLLLILVASLATPAVAQSPPPAPVQLAGAPGSWYAGGTPPNHDPSKPVLVFVHGKGGSAATWWADTAYHGPNDMYAYAYSNGYQTAFVNLEPEADMWVNGELLHELLEEITAHFGVERVVIVAHSKGGVDSNAAVTFFGSSSMVEKVITLGSPHWGTPLADLAYSTWTWWLAALLGQQTDATYVMQTGYMAWFRSQADGSEEQVPFHTVGGRKCGPFLTALWWGCVYLAGEDDGVVPLESQHKPGGSLVANVAWDHDEIRMGSRVWGSISGLLGTSGASSGLSAGQSGPGALGNMLLRGGEVTGNALGQPFPLEAGVRKATLVFYASSPEFAATLTGPDGSSHTVKMAAQVPAGDIFAGAWVGSLEQAKPEAGEWSFTTASSERAGYLMVAALDSDFAARLKTGSLVVAPGETQNLAVSFSQEPVSVRASGTLGPQPVAFTGRKVKVTVPQQQGIHNLTVTVTGTLADGSTFERSLITSFAAVPKGTVAPWTGR